jgi:hypothetical protein
MCDKMTHHQLLIKHYNQFMATFIIIPLPHGEHKLHKIIPEKMGKSCFCLQNGDWLVSFEGTSRQLSDELGITEGDSGSGVVLNFSGYWGRASKDLWEWIDEFSK